MDITIGTKYQSGGKRRDVCTVIDIHRTYNYAGELVKTRYVSQHMFLGKVVTDYDVVATTIKRGLAESV